MEMYKCEMIIEPYQLKTQRIVRDKILNIIGDLIDNHKLKNFVLEQDLVPLNDMETHQVLDSYTSQNGVYCYLGEVLSYAEMIEVLRGFRKLVVKIETIKELEGK